MKHVSLYVALALASTSCAVGYKTANFAVAHQPAGVATTLDLGTVMRGELLAVEDNALIVLSEQQITRVPYTTIRKATFAQTGISIRDFAVSTAERDKLRLLSRYPQGLTPALLQSLLAAYRQSEVATPR
jgi:hypothetical protein